jgi:pimeloyl-[acyl-carrier protein] methyl ester esterase
MKQSTIIIFPGWGMEKAAFHPLIKSLSTIYSVSFTDWRGVRELSDFKERAIQILTSTQGTVYLIGWSLGSLITLELASLYPKKIEGLILIGGTSRFTNDVHYIFGWEQRIVERMKKQLQRNKEKTLTAFYSAMFTKSEKEEEFHHQFIEVVQRDYQGDSTHSLLTGLDYLLQKDVRMHLNKIQTPCLLVHGKDDQICFPESSSFIAKRIGGKAQLCILEKAGHIPFFTKPQQCTQLIEKFLEKELIYD